VCRQTRLNRAGSSQLSEQTSFDALIERVTGPARGTGDLLLKVARMRLFDTAVACTIGLNLPEAQGLRALLAGGPQARITALVAATRATEVDDIAISACVTPGSVVVPVALVCGAEAGLPLLAALDAIVDGYEAMIATAEAIDGAYVVYKGVWPTLAAAAAGAVVTAGRLLRRDAAAVRDALILATVRTVARPERSLSRWWLLGCAAADAVASCRLDALPAGDPASIVAWATAQGFVYAPASLAPGAAGIARVDVKPFPTARQGLATISAFRRLAARVPLAESDRIVVTVPGVYAGMIGGTGLPANRIESLLRVSYQMALVALVPERLFDVARSDLPAGPELARFLSRVTVTVDPDLDRLYPRSWAGAVRFETGDGSSVGAGVDVTEVVHDPEGSASASASASAAFGWPELAAKAASLARANGIAPERFETLERLIRDDGSPDSILDLVMGR
jgi:2-methylcitrate dehydratase PrpD